MSEPVRGSGSGSAGRLERGPGNDAARDGAARDLLPPTPGQTVGPFFGFALPYARGNELVEPGTPGAVRLHGTVRDGAGSPVPDALIEIWHADPAGAVVRRSGSILRDGTFTGWGRAETDREGGYWFRTLTPGATDPGRPPFFAVTVFARGLQDRLFTRAYLPDALEAGQEGPQDPLLASLEPARRATLVTTREPDGSLRFDIRLQGEGETVFLAYDTGTYGAAVCDGAPQGATPHDTAPHDGVLDDDTTPDEGAARDGALDEGVSPGGAPQDRSPGAGRGGAGA